MVANLDINFSWLDPGRWLWSPGFGRSASLLGLLLILVTAGFAIRSVIWWKASGPVSDAERRALRRKGWPSRLWFGLLNFIAVGYPLCLAAAVAMLVLQWNRRAAILLVSRQSQVVETGGAWSHLAADAAQRDPIFMDAGRVVDRALALLSSNPNLPPLSAESDEVRIAAAAAVKTAIAEASQNRIARLWLNAPAKASLAPPTDLPGPLIQSVELACLRLLVERFNAGDVIVLAGPRRDAMGVDPWLGATNYLRPADRLFGSPQVHIVDSPETRGVTLVSADLFTTGQDRCLALSFFVPGATVPVDETTTIQASGQQWALTFKRAGRDSVQMRLIQLPPSLPDPDTVKAIFANRAAIEKEVGSLRKLWAGRSIQILCPDKWINCLSQLTRSGENLAAGSGSWWFAAARNRLFSDAGLLPAQARVLVTTHQTPPSPGSIVIDVRSNGILEYCASGSGNAPAEPVFGSLATNTFNLFVWSRTPSSDPVFAFQGLELPPTRLLVPGDRPEGADTLAAPLLRLQDLPGHHRYLDQAVMTILPDARFPDKYSLVWIGIDVREADLASSFRDWTNDMKAASFWVATMAAATDCLKPAPYLVPSDVSGNSLTILNSSDIEQESAAVYAAGSYCVIFGLLAAGVWSVAQALMQRGRG